SAAEFLQVLQKWMDHADFSKRKKALKTLVEFAHGTNHRRGEPAETFNALFPSIVKGLSEEERIEIREVMSNNEKRFGEGEEENDENE
ncbi:hypothetical protein PENTCL1PPCAC_9933, partial [Pristionchus entomophagus]